MAELQNLTAQLTAQSVAQAAQQAALADQANQLADIRAQMTQVVELIGNLRVVETNDDEPNPLGVQNPTVDKLKKEHMEVIPIFKGDPEHLHYFLEITGQLAARFYNHDNERDFQNVMLMAAIKSKIHPPAKNTVPSHAKTYEDIREALLSAYSDKRDIFTLGIELTKMRQMDSESPFDFHKRILKILHLITAYAMNHRIDHSEILIDHYEKMALRCLLLHLKEPLGSILRTRQPADLPTALAWMVNDYQLLCNNNRPRANPTNQNSRPQNPRPQNYPQNFQNNRPQTSQNSQNLRPSNNPRPVSKPQIPQPPQPQAKNQSYPQKMSWQTTNPNLHNVGSSETDDILDPQIEGNYEDTPMEPTDYETEPNPFLEMTSLDPSQP